MADRITQCSRCNGSGWVCECCRKPFGECEGAGEPCECNPAADFQFEAVIASVDPEQVERWVQ